MALAARSIEHAYGSLYGEPFCEQLVLWGPPTSRGQVLLEALRHQEDVLPFVYGLRHLATMTVADPSELSVAEALAMVVSHVVAMGCWASSSAQRMTRELARWQRHLQILGVERLVDITPADILEMLDAPVSAGLAEPMASTRRFRLAALRLFFRALRQLHVVVLDPTLDIRVDPGASIPTRPLTNEEELVGRVVAGHTLAETRRQVAWALGQATATTGEQARVRVRHVDLPSRRVWLEGTSRRQPRWGLLTDWGQDVIARAVARRAHSDAGLVYMAGVSDDSGTASACKAVHNILKDAGYGKDSGIRPGSLPAWRGAQIFQETGAIDVVALRLGINNLEEAAKTIGWDWRR